VKKEQTREEGEEEQAKVDKVDKVTEGWAIPNSTTSWLRSVRQEVFGYDALVEGLISEIGPALSGSTPTWGPHCFLLHGVPGCGKTSLALSIAKHSGVPCCVIKAAQVYGARQGSAESVLSAAFQGVGPRIVVVDDIDALCPSSSGPWSSGPSPTSFS